MPKPEVSPRALGASMALGLVATVIALPWLVGWTWGPHPDMVQRLLSATCAAVLLLAWAARRMCQPSAWPPGDWLVRCIALGWISAACVSALMALVQYFGVLASHAAAHTAHAAAPDQTLGSMLRNILDACISPSQPGTAYANLRQRNQFASLTSLGLVGLLAWLALSAPARTQGSASTALRHASTALVITVLALGNAASGSRTGALQWLLIAALALWWQRHHWRHPQALVDAARRPYLAGWALLAVLCYLASCWYLPWALERVTGQVGLSVFARFQEDSGTQSRSVLWANMLGLIAQKPWLGWGWGELKFAHFIYPYPGARFSDIVDNAHNLPLHLAVELGLPLALLICTGVLVWLLHARPWRAHEPADQLAWGALAVLGLHSLLEYPLWYGPFQLALLLCIVLLYSSRHHARAAAPQSTARTLYAPAAATCAATLLCASAYAAWDYWRIGQLYIAPAQRAPQWRDDTFEKVKDSVLFHNTVQFAYVTTTPVTPETAPALYLAATQMLHYSPEPRVIAVLLESAQMLEIDTPSLDRIRQQSLRAYPTGK